MRRSLRAGPCGRTGSIAKGLKGQTMVFLGSTEDGRKQNFDLKFANRHGLIAGATGTGKTVSLQVLAEGFSQAGIPVFMADVKGDLSGMSQPGAMQDFLTKRAAKIGYDDYAPAAMPVIYWDIFGEKGHPMRATVSEMGPLLLTRILELNDTQEGVLSIAFRVADEEGLLLLDLKDLQSLLADMAARSSELSAKYGNISDASVASIQRRLLQLEDQGGAKLFGEPALDFSDIMRKSGERGCISILAADKLVQSPRLYATFLLWMLSELFEQLPEAGDLPQPKLAFFFDEAHLLFNDAPKALLEKIEQVVRLIRSKGVGVYFVSKSPTDIPENVLAQLGCRIQHALRAYTPQAQKGVKVAAQSFRANPAIDTEKMLTELGIGEALVSTLGEGGVPGMVERVFMAPPRALLGPVTEAQRQSAMAQSPVRGMYDQAIDRQSAYEILKARAQQASTAADQAQSRARTSAAPQASGGGGRQRQTLAEAAVKSVIRTMGSEVGRQLIRGLLGSLRR
ncbi:MAG: DUF853 family protein [Rhodospirillales bacterium]|nr:DUF853 family protein [Rhodospirillales bacterium]